LGNLTIQTIKLRFMDIYLYKVHELTTKPIIISEEKKKKREEEG